MLCSPRSTSTDAAKPPSRARRVTALEPVRESTPNNELRDVSMFLKNPISPFDSTPDQSPRQAIADTPSSLPPLPPSPVKSMIEYISVPPQVEALAAEIKKRDLVQEGVDALHSLRNVCSARLHNTTSSKTLSSFFLTHRIYGVLLFFLKQCIFYPR